ncbi:MAG: hypothetical protein IT424_06855 [Pirellulales bacterium]|nr:hypothetical protein [Pirellulales bacterium]
MRAWVVCSIIVAGLLGCGEQPVDRATVRGRVSFRGEPIQDGTILFSPVGGGESQAAGPSSGKIIGGAYQLDGDNGPVVGSHRVEIQAYRKTGRKIPDMLGDVSKANRALVEEVVPMLPAEFNVESTLTADVAPGENTKDFNL